MRFFALLRFLWPYSSVNSVFHLNFINTPCTHSARRGCTFEHFSQMHSDGFSSIAWAMLATTICFPSSPVHTQTHAAHATTFNNRFNWFTTRIRIAYEGICVRNDLAFVYVLNANKNYMFANTFVVIVIAFIWNALLAWGVKIDSNDVYDSE